MNKQRRALKTILGRMGDAMDLSEFDALDVVLGCCGDTRVGAAGLYYVPPGWAASPAAQQALADAQARLAAAQAALAAERQIDQTLGPMGIIKMQQQADAAAAAAAPSSYDDVLGDVEDSDVDLVLDGLRHDRASRHRGAAYLETDDE
jgi:predicted amidohydrolase